MLFQLARSVVPYLAPNYVRNVWPRGKTHTSNNDCIVAILLTQPHQQLHASGPLLDPKGKRRRIMNTKREGVHRWVRNRVIKLEHSKIYLFSFLTSGTVSVVTPLMASSMVWVCTSRCSNWRSNWSITPATYREDNTYSQSSCSILLISCSLSIPQH